MATRPLPGRQNPYRICGVISTFGFPSGHLLKLPGKPARPFAPAVLLGPTNTHQPNSIMTPSSLLHSRYHRATLVLLTALLALPAVQAQTAPANRASGASGETVVLDKLEITEKTAAPLSTLSSTAAAAQIASVAGGAYFIDQSLVGRGRVSTSADVLAFTPGVFAAPPAGNGDGIKISARGSGIARSAGNFFRNGLLFTFDGLPVTGPGGTPYELFETYGLRDTQVWLGGNAFDNGSLALGGHINYITKTGYDAKPFEARIDVGSFGYRKYQASTGQVVGKFDYYASITSAQADGYQNWARGSSEGFAGNLGYRVSDTTSTRFYLRYRTTENQNPGNISLKELDRDTSNSPINRLQKSNRIQPGSTWLGNTTVFQITPDSKLELGFVHHNAPIDIQPNPSPGNAAGTHDNPTINTAGAGLDRSLWNFRDVSTEAKYTRQDTLFGLDSDSTVALNISYEYDGDVNIYANNPNITTGVRKFQNLLKTANYDGSSDSSLRFGNKLSLTEKLRFDTGLSVVNIRRQGEYTYYNPLLPAVVKPAGNTGSTIDQDDYYLAPRVGLLYTFSPGNTAFANVTRSLEAPNSWQLSGGSNAAWNYHLPIDNQDAIAYEIGTRLTRGAFNGGITLFHSDVKNELLTVLIDPANPGLGSTTFNGPDTYKQGVELSLNTTLWSENGFLSAAPSGQTTKVTFAQSLTANRFGYKNENVFAIAPTDPNGFKKSADELPGVPDLNYQARLTLDHRSGFYVNGSLFHASSYYADFSNVLEVPDYTLFDVGFGYKAPSGYWEAFIDLRNVTDEAYASSAGPIYTPTLVGGLVNANATRETRTIQAGDGRAIYGGLTVRF
ncbi:MAG: TonB-dependent receptor [Verrucomicrobia bacterium]|nr:TonB-dependent receptor [Verrucomicrobiota bacterium]